MFPPTKKKKKIVPIKSELKPLNWANLVKLNLLTWKDETLSHDYAISMIWVFLIKKIK